MRIRRRHRRESTTANVAGEVAEGVGTEVVAQFGCCAIEAVGALSVLAGLMLVPAYLLLS